jgi:pimeloyl-ACP methyl ester carboxylesterase
MSPQYRTHFHRWRTTSRRRSVCSRSKTVRRFSLGILGAVWSSARPATIPRLPVLSILRRSCPKAGSPRRTSLSRIRLRGLGQAKPDRSGFLRLSREGVNADFVPDLPPAERDIVYATQGTWKSTALADKVTSPAWKSKRSWFIAVNDRMLQPQYEQDIAKHIHATTTTLTSGHVPMLSQPNAVAAVILDAAEKAGRE